MIVFHTFNDQSYCLLYPFIYFDGRILFVYSFRDKKDDNLNGFVK